MAGRLRGRVLQMSYARNGPRSDDVRMSRRRFMGLAVALLALNAFFWAAQGSFALPRAVIGDLLGKRMIRAEIVQLTPTGVPEDIQVDRGVITAAAAASLTIQEADGRVVTYTLTPTTRVVGATTRPRNATRLRVGFRVLVVRHANGPAEIIQVEGRGAQ